ncbi:hypothetical protein EBT16_01290 [bacterium]|nr:hypothetical protein [bacterium]
MASRCAISLLNNFYRPPKKLIICSLDQINDGDVNFTLSTEFWCGRQMIFKMLKEKGISNECIMHMFEGFKNSGNPNMWFKYIVPRLCVESDKVVVLDDDVAISGPCRELIDSEAYLTFMEDDDPFYGERTINFFNERLNTNIYCKKKPYVCAGVYKINKTKKNYDASFINDLILKSEHDTDEQSAVGMEIIEGTDYLTLKPPKYHHGGWREQNADVSQVELMHMQGRAAGWRNNKEFIDLFMKKQRS